MSFFSLKNILLIGILLLLLVGIPLGVYLTQQQQVSKSQAEKSSTLTFVPASSELKPLDVVVGDEFKFDMMVTPGSNKVTVVAFEINYDPSLFALSETDPFVINEKAFPVTMDEPIFEDGIIKGKISTSNIQTAVTSSTKVATITFVALEESTTPSTITFGSPYTQVFSAGQADEAGEDVLSSTVPAFVATSLEGDSVPDKSTPTGSSPSISTSPTASPAGASKGSVPTNTPPVCTSLTANGALSGIAPFAAAFTAVGKDPDGRITKATFNFGDGQTKDASNSAVASGSATFAQEHEYTTAGTHRASVLFTDNQGGISAQGSCVLTMTITSPVTPTETPGIPAEPTATIAPTGPNDAFIGLGIFAGIFAFLGGILFFTL